MFTDGATVTGGATATPEQEGRPRVARLLLSAETNAEGDDATAVIPDATLLAADADATDTVNATAAPEASNRRRATSVTPVTATAVGSTFSDKAMAETNPCCAVMPSIAAVRPPKVAEEAA
jgi:hypothetical protein